MVSQSARSNPYGLITYQKRSPVYYVDLLAAWDSMGRKQSQGPRGQGVDLALCQRSHTADEG